MLAGKTLIARQIGKLLNATEPKIVNGPEVLDKFVGESEKKVRELFADAERDEAALAEDSPLHVIIFDEIDAICKARGSTGGGTGVHDSIVNTLLTKIDGVEALNNILLIGTHLNLLQPSCSVQHSTLCMVLLHSLVTVSHGFALMSRSTCHMQWMVCVQE